MMKPLEINECGTKIGIVTCLDGKERKIIVRTDNTIHYMNVKNGESYGPIHKIKEKTPKWINKESLSKLTGIENSP